MILFLTSLYILKMIVFYWIAKRIHRWRKELGEVGGPILNKIKSFT
jgi:hypothetical protein